MRIVLIVIAALSVIIISLIGFRLIGDKRYEQQITLAEKALQEGNYTQAEVEYLKAVDMKKKEPKAYKGLAYTYVAVGKYEDATETYNKLYEITGEELFQSASADTSEGRIPLIAGISLSNQLWVKTDPEHLNNKEEAIELLDDYLSSSAYVYSIDSNESKFEYCFYNSENPAESYALMTTQWLINENRFPEYIDSVKDIGDGSDPRGWADYSCLRVTKKAVEDVYSKIFNVDNEGLAEAVKNCESRHMMYLEGDYYYIPYVPKDGYAIENEVNQVWINGDKCCIEYKSYERTMNASGDKTYFATYYAIMTRKNSMWTFLYNGSETPKGINIISNNQNAMPEAPPEEPLVAEDGTDTNTDGYTEDQLCEMAQEYYYRHTGFRPPISEVDHKSGDIITIHLYEINGNHTATSDWYDIDIKTAKGTNISGEVIDLTEVE